MKPLKQAANDGINFDIAVTASETDGVGGKASVNLLKVVTISADGSTKSKEESVSRIRFNVQLNDYHG
jgi:hypothetical protein